MKKNILVNTILCQVFLGILFSFKTCPKFNPGMDFNFSTKQFIDSVKPLCIKNGKYVVFVAKILTLDTLKKEFCYSISFINNSYEFEAVMPDFVYYFDNEIILIQLSGSGSKYIANYLRLSKILDEDKFKVIDKLYPKDKGFITAITQGLIYCRKGTKAKSIFYSNSDEIPDDKFIYKDFPKNFRIDLIKSGK